MQLMDFAMLQQMMHPALLALLAVVVVSLGAALLITGGIRLTNAAKKSVANKAPDDNPVKKSDRSTAVSASLFKLKKSKKAQPQAPTK